MVEKYLDKVCEISASISLGLLLSMVSQNYIM